MKIIKRGGSDYRILFWLLEKDALKSVKQHICLCRNEDVLFPDPKIILSDEKEFDQLAGFELRFGKSDKSFLVGFNRFEDAKPMYGWLDISGKPVTGM